MIINQWFIRRTLAKMGIRIDFRVNIQLIGRILKIGLPVFVAAIFMSPITWLTNKLVFNTEGGAYALGVVFVCRQLLVLMQFIPVQISRITLPIIANRSSLPEENRIKKLSLLLSFSFCIFLIWGGVLFEGPILSAYGLDVDVSSRPYRISLVTIVFSSINLIVGQFAIAGRNPWNRAFADAIIALVTILVAIIMIRRDLLIALPLATLLAFIVSNIFLVYTTRKEIPWLDNLRHPKVYDVV